MSGGTNIFAEDGTLAPRLVVNITIDQLRTDFLETFEPFYGTDGFKKIYDFVDYQHFLWENENKALSSFLHFKQMQNILGIIFLNG